MDPVRGRTLVAGRAQGRLAWAPIGLSFWGGVDPASGRVIDHHHPLHGLELAGRVLAIPSGRGSCTGSAVLLELLLAGRGPAALLLAEPDEILSLGAIVAEELFGLSLPVVSLGAEAFAALAEHDEIAVSDGWIGAPGSLFPATDQDEIAELQLSATDQAMLDGAQGRAVQAAMRILVRMAHLQGAGELLDITQAHIDGCIYTGPASLAFAQRLVEWGGKVRVPTSLNAVSVDQRRWREQGVAPALGEPASALAEAYVALGCRPTFTCAPYLLDSAPALGEQVVWAESNAVVFANSVLGARTQKYADFLDICTALTGRAPLAGCHLDSGRRAAKVLRVRVPDGHDDAFYPLLGYWIGLRSSTRIPAVLGLEHARPSRDDLKAFGAAFATTSAAPLFHLVGVTPEAPTLAAVAAAELEIEDISLADLRQAWAELDSAAAREVQLVALGNPHFSAEECQRLAELCCGRRKHPQVALVITLGREVRAAAERAGSLADLEAFGAQLVGDTCWCMLGEPLVPPLARTLLTNSGKFAHYGPGLTGRALRFAGLAACVEAACTGLAPAGPPAWLTAADLSTG
ncbi:cis-3-hydroxy-L-proline dehydratase [Pseudomonas oryzihabitans]|uniref:cis-3-hydroxy-L-proline dehydratase n=1 Tax=Pseudomonas oryzihabitans TaxID=47885 RepID=UPI00285C6E07|nr:aconitase family protein [Pseudomonas psychrotolerans]MDR6680606.1 putative aconitase/putative aconitase with swiveling domain [Pseudomonas psychrotolerans]